MLAPPVPPPGPARTSDIPPENAVYMLPAVCPTAGLAPTTVAVRPGDSGGAPEMRPGATAKATLDRVWPVRARLPGLCLEYAAWAAAKAGREEQALRLFAVGNVREAYDRARCRPAERRDYSSYADAHGIAQMMRGMDVDLLRRRAADWLPLAKAAARDDATYSYDVDLSKVCDLSGPRPADEWVEARRKVAEAVAAQQLPPAAPSAAAPRP